MSAAGPPGGTIYICVRKTLDWSDEALVRSQIRPRFRPKLDTWNATLDPPYHRFRQRLKELAELNHSRVEGATRADFDQVPPGALVVPVDDDDWFAPDLSQRLLSAYDPALDGYHWRRELIEPPRRAEVRRRRWRWLRPWRPIRRDHYTCLTNNYALRSQPEFAPLALSHKRASEHFDAHPSRVRFVAATLGIQNRNMASQTSLTWKRPHIDRDELVAVYQRYRDLYAGWKLAPELSWARPYVDGMAELMAQVRVR